MTIVGCPSILLSMKFNNIIFLNSRIREYAYAYIVHELKRVGHKSLAPSHGDILASLYKSGTLSKTALAKKINRDRSTVTTLVKKLEALGYVQVAPDSHDSRTSLVSLTEKGEKMRDDFFQISQNLHSVAYQNLDEKEIELLQRLLQKVYENFMQTL